MPNLEKIISDIMNLDELEREGLLRDIYLLIRHRSFGLMTSELHAALDFPSIVRTPGICGGSARFIRTRIPIWTLEKMRHLKMSEADILKSFPTLTALDLVQAWDYVDRHRSEIDAEIQENEE